MLGHFAARNRLGRMRLGVCVTDAGRRSPAVTAQAAVTLRLLTTGRAMLGIGVGEREGNEPYSSASTSRACRMLLPQVVRAESVLSCTAKVPLSLTKESSFQRQPDEVVKQVAVWSDHGLRYLLVVNASPLQRSLIKGAMSTLPYVKVLRKVKELSA